MPQPTTNYRPPDTWAEVRAHDRVMRYRRSGVGRAVLLLRPDDGDRSLWPELSNNLAERFRLIAPDVPPDAADVAAWIRGFLEGLGVAAVAVLAAEPFCIAALELALLEPERVARLALVPAGSGEETGLDGALDGPTRGAAVPLLVVRRGLQGAEALPLLERFLAGEGTRAGG